MPRAQYGKPDLFVHLQTLFGAGAGHLTNQVVGTVTSGLKIGGLTADQWIYDHASTNPQYGNYTLLLPGSLNDSAAPGGYSFATLKVATNGNVTATGNLADSTVLLPTGTAVSAEGRWPLYQKLYTGGKTRNLNYTNNTVTVTNLPFMGTLIGWLQFTNNETIGGDVHWTKTVFDPADVVASPVGIYTNYYPLGFTNTLPATGLSYVQRTNDPTNLRLIDVTNATITFDGSFLSGSPQSQDIYIKSNNQVGYYGYVPGTITSVTNPTTHVVTKTTNFVVAVTTTGTNTALAKLAVAFTATTGKVSGSFTNAFSQTPTGGMRPVTFSGVVLQPENTAYGYFLATNKSGAFHLEATPTPPTP